MSPPLRRTVGASGPVGARTPHAARARRHGGLRVAVVAVTVAVLGACGSQPAPGGPETPRPTPTSLELPSRDVPTTPSPAPSATDGAPGVAEAVTDLADHLGVDPADVTVVSREDVTWPDGSLGCPQPGVSYTMAQVPGSRLVLAAQGREFSYHAGREPVYRRCDRPSLAPGDTH